MTSPSTRSPDPFIQFKAAQREGWATFTPLETFTTTAAAHLVDYARLRPGQTVLDVACGTGVVAITAARQGARVRALDLAPALLERAHWNARLAGAEVDFVEGDAEALPYEDGTFDVVLSQFGHMFAPRPEIAARELIRVLKPGGTLAFSTWPPHLFTGQLFSLVGRYLPPPPGVAPSPQWGDPTLVRERLGEAVRDLVFEQRDMMVTALSPAHARHMFEQTAAPIIKLKQTLQSEPARWREFEADLEALVARYTERNQIRQTFLMSRAVKR